MDQGKKDRHIHATAFHFRSGHGFTNESFGVWRVLPLWEIGVSSHGVALKGVGYDCIDSLTSTLRLNGELVGGGVLPDNITMGVIIWQTRTSEYVSEAKQRCRLTGIGLVLETIHDLGFFCVQRFLFVRITDWMGLASGSGMIVLLAHYTV